MRLGPSSGMPPNWAMPTLAEIAGVNPRRLDPEPTDSDLVSFVPMPAVEAGTGRLDPSATRPWAQVKRGYTRFQNGDVLVAKITPCMENGKFALAVGLRGGVGAGSTEFHVVRPMGGISGRYLLRFLLQECIRRDARALMQGAAGQLRVPVGFVESLPVPLAPLAEQARIVAALDQHLTRLDAGVEALRRVLAKLKTYRASVLKAACEGRLVPTEAELARREGRGFETAGDLLRRIGAAGDAADDAGLGPLPEGWAWTKLLGLLREPLRNGRSAPAAEGPTGVRTLTLTAVTQGDFSEKNTKLTSARLADVGDLWLEPGDILVERSNTPELVGTARVYLGPRGFAIFPDLMIRVRLARQLLDRYVEYVLRTERTRRYFRTAAQGIAGSMPKISQPTVEQVTVPLPPLAEQHRIVAEVERRLSVVDKVAFVVETGLARAGKLRQAILKRAFEGKLVPQDPADEPASVLLERIRAERAAAGQQRQPDVPRRGGRRGGTTRRAKPEARG